VALTLLLWGRGVYCGWLCPFGALQELLHQLAQRLGIPEYRFPDVVHERLTALKYIIFVALFGLSLQSIGYAARAAEVEPFKTAIVMHFNRDGIFFWYALALLLVAVFNRKFFCKYLCPLGAALAIPAPLRIFDWLRRRKECGRPCQICAIQCEVQAIRPTGEINPNECHYCLDCQVTYWDDHQCPPLSEKRVRKEKSRATLERLRQAEKTSGNKRSGTGDDKSL
jgi:NosR/NirI family nitrous oxide reductase transcriptional regulator